MMLTRAPDFDVANAKFSGTFSAPERMVTPAAITSPAPTGEKFGPIPNSKPLALRKPASQLSYGSACPCSRPEINGTNSVRAAIPSGDV